MQRLLRECFDTVLSRAKKKREDTDLETYRPKGKRDEQGWNTYGLHDFALYDMNHYTLESITLVEGEERCICKMEEYKLCFLGLSHLTDWGS